jgi:drug/metabolite transporter (DMT)-like permease
MNIGGIVKQILSIVLGFVVFQTPMTLYTFVGVFITVVGIMMYARESYSQKMRAQGGAAQGRSLQGGAGGSKQPSKAESLA